MEEKRLKKKKAQKKQQDVKSAGEWIEDNDCKPRTQCKVRLVFGKEPAGA